MDSLVAPQRHLWLTFTDMRDADKSPLLNTPVSLKGLFGEVCRGPESVQDDDTLRPPFGTFHVILCAVVSHTPHRPLSKVQRCDPKPPVQQRPNRKHCFPMKQGHRPSGRPAESNPSSCRPEASLFFPVDQKQVCSAISKKSSSSFTSPPADCGGQSKMFVCCVATFAEHELCAVQNEG